MKQAKSVGFYWDPVRRVEVSIPQGAVRPDDHPDVAFCPSNFRDVDIEQPSPVTSAPPRPPAKKAAAPPAQPVQGQKSR